MKYVLHMRVKKVPSAPRMDSGLILNPVGVRQSQFYEFCGKSKKDGGKNPSFLLPRHAFILSSKFLPMFCHHTHRHKHTYTNGASYKHPVTDETANISLNLCALIDGLSQCPEMPSRTRKESWEEK